MTPEVLSLIAAYVLCSETAATRMLNAGEGRACMETYQEVKLSFVAGLEPTTYAALDPIDRAYINRRGYQAFGKWKRANPQVVADMEQRAKATLRNAP